MEYQQLEGLCWSLSGGASSPGPEAVKDLIKDPNAWLKNRRGEIRGGIGRYRPLDGLLSVDFPSEDTLFPRLHVLTIACCTDALRYSRATLEDFQKKRNELDGLPLLSKLASFKSSRQLAHYTIRNTRRRSPNHHPVQRWVHDLSRHDFFDIAAIVIRILKSEELRETFLRAKPVPSVDQGLLDLFEVLLSLALPKEARDTLFRSQLKLARNSGLFPSNLIRHTIENRSVTPLVTMGCFGDIYKASFLGHSVAVKVMRNLDRFSTASAIKKLGQEAVLWNYVKHPNILPFYGIYLMPDGCGTHRLSLLSPWMINGNLVEYIKANPEADRERLILDIVRGLDYLHSHTPAIVHGDLKSDNILISPSGRACLADFGLGRLVHDKQWLSSTISTVMGAELFLAPELMSEVSSYEADGIVKKTLKTDVYAFACVSYEVYAGRPRFSDILFPIPRYQAILTNGPCQRPPSIPDNLWEHMKRCWVLNPEERPAISEFFNVLDPEGYCKSPPEGQVVGGEWDVGIPGSIESSVSWMLPPPDMQSAALTLRREESLEGSSAMDTGQAASQSPGVRNGIRLQRWDAVDLKQKDVIILVMGAPLSGKTAFVQSYFSNSDLEVGPIHHELLSPSHKITAYLEPGGSTPTRSTTTRGRGGVLMMVDTPGMFSGTGDDVAIVTEVVDLLVKNRNREIRIVFLHDISQSRITQDVTMSLSLLKAMCGRGVYKHVWIASTHWGEHAQPGSQAVAEHHQHHLERTPSSTSSAESSTMGSDSRCRINASATGQWLKVYEERERALSAGLWKDLLDGGAHYHRLARPSVWRPSPPTISSSESTFAPTLSTSSSTPTSSSSVGSALEPSDLVALVLADTADAPRTLAEMYAIQREMTLPNRGRGGGHSGKGLSTLDGTKTGETLKGCVANMLGQEVKEKGEKSRVKMLKKQFKALGTGRVTT